MPRHAINRTFRTSVARDGRPRREIFTSSTGRDSSAADEVRSRLGEIASRDHARPRVEPDGRRDRRQPSSTDGLRDVRYEVDGRSRRSRSTARARTRRTPDDRRARRRVRLAEADDVRVVVLAAEGKHFSAGHDLKEILAGEEHWAAMRGDARGQARARAGHVLGQARADPRLPEDHDRRGAGHVLAPPG